MVFDRLRDALLAHCPVQSEATRMVDGYYLPVCQWIAQQRQPGRCVVVFVNGPQGAGKSTLCTTAVRALGDVGIRAVTVSIDDFYLTYAQQCELAAHHPGNPFLEFRGYPGTHDVKLGTSVICALRDDPGAGIRVPVYDKSSHGGRGDRAVESQWKTEHGLFEIVLVEGWMLGFESVEVSSLPDLRMAFSNLALSTYSPWNQLCDAFVHLAMASPTDVIEWRMEAERVRRSRGEPGLTDAQARDYVYRFLPAYEVWVPSLRGAVVGRRPSFWVTLGIDRHPTELKQSES
jgi:D-glycerate 3-kinase